MKLLENHLYRIYGYVLNTSRVRLSLLYYIIVIYGRNARKITRNEMHKNQIKSQSVGFPYSISTLTMICKN